jgi:hypothetical protein
MSSCKNVCCGGRYLPKLFLYQNQKLIWNTVRVPSSLYQNDFSAATIYQYPILPRRVNWNQSSDRAIPHGHGEAKGIDIKHNSYDRYYGRLKGKKAVKAQTLPLAFGKPIPFNLAYPVYGNKIVKTNILGYNCRCHTNF